MMKMIFGLLVLVSFSASAQVEMTYDLAGTRCSTAQADVNLDRDGVWNVWGKEYALRVDSKKVVLEISRNSFETPWANYESVEAIVEYTLTNQVEKRMDKKGPFMFDDTITVRMFCDETKEI